MHKVVQTLRPLGHQVAVKTNKHKIESYFLIMQVKLLLKLTSLVVWVCGGSGPKPQNGKTKIS